ncbi:MAG: glutamate-5-semialdehyde dehydrogenase, partial [Alphaproteobacteria bacterium]|nr:glutamate-5-semialdehyde dehydrogenase [Alphaproteobacteria bacterium]
MTLRDTLLDQARAARAAYRTLAESPNEARDAALKAAAKYLRANKNAVLEANARDMAGGKAKNLSAALLDRLMLDDKRVEAMAKGCEEVATLPDPLGKVEAAWDRPNGLHIERVTIPLGVIGIIYESRPNVTADAAALCIKSGNAAILRGGSESFESSQEILKAMRAGLKEAGLPEDAVQSISTTDRAAVGELLTLTGEIDVIIPRGGKSLTERVMTESRVPTLLHLDGNCHVYIHAKAKPEMAVAIVTNAKLRRTGVCGAAESLLIDRLVASALLPKIADALVAGGCEIRGDAESRKLDARIVPATEEDWSTEYLDKIISVKIVDGAKEAVEHINRYGSHHTDAIVTEDKSAAETFLRQVDSAIVLHNASTQFADGGEFGMGAEIGIATGRLHARGPVGAGQLVTYK